MRARVGHHLGLRTGIEVGLKFADPLKLNIEVALMPGDLVFKRAMERLRSLRMPQAKPIDVVNAMMKQGPACFHCLALATAVPVPGVTEIVDSLARCS